MTEKDIKPILSLVSTSGPITVSKLIELLSSFEGDLGVTITAVYEFADEITETVEMPILHISREGGGSAPEFVSINVSA